MKVLHVVFGYFPDHFAGTEIYVAALAKQLSVLGVESVVAAPAEEDAAYVHDGVRVRRYRHAHYFTDRRELYAKEDSRFAGRFASILDEERPDIVHFHAYTSGIATQCVLESKKRGAAVIFTSHTANSSCQRGTLLKNGREICSGKIDEKVCSACVLEANGVPLAAASLLSRVPAAFGDAVGSMKLGGAWTALQMRHLIQCQHKSFDDFMAAVDRVVTFGEWGKNVMIANGVPENKIRVSRPVTPYDFQAPAEPSRRPAKPLRFVYVGRFHPIKGPQVIAQAFRKNTAEMTLDFYGYFDNEENAYARSLKRVVGADRRMRFCGRLEPQAVSATFVNYDAVLIPSQCLETGPMTLLEAFAAKRPVIGSCLGGIAELMTDGREGLLIDDWSSPEAWSRALMKIFIEPSLLESFRSRIKAPRTALRAAEEMKQLYAETRRQAAVA